MVKIVGVRFKNFGKTYYFSPKDIELVAGDGVIVETARGLEYGTVSIAPKEIKKESVPQALKDVIRKANQKDMAQLEKNKARAQEAFVLCKEKAIERGLDMKLVEAEVTFDKSKIIISFTSDNRVDFRMLVRDLASVFKVRIELRQIGIRDEAKATGGIAQCGRPCCCATFGGEFPKVGVKMAKTQGLSLNPGKISGICGRLMCCLAYENDHYAETIKKMPKLGSSVTTPDGVGTASGIDALKETVRVKVEVGDRFEFKDFPLGELKFSKKAPQKEKDDDVSESE